MHRGYIKLYRKLEDWEWYDDLRLVGFFVHLVLSANYNENRYHGYIIPRGSLVFGRKAAAKKFGIGERSVRTMLTRLKATGEVTIKTTNKFSIVSIVNFEKYQSQSTTQTTNNLSLNRPATDQQPTTLKEVKKLRSKEYKESAPRDPSNQICLKSINHPELSEPIKHKIFNQLITIFRQRGWRDDSEYVKGVFERIVNSLNGHKPEKFFPYFRKVALNHINENAELFAADARINQEKSVKLGMNVLGVSV